MLTVCCSAATRSVVRAVVAPVLCVGTELRVVPAVRLLRVGIRFGVGELALFAVVLAGVEAGYGLSGGSAYGPVVYVVAVGWYLLWPCSVCSVLVLG